MIKGSANIIQYLSEFSKTVNELASTEAVYRYGLRKIHELFRGETSFIYLLNKEDQFELRYEFPRSSPRLNRKFSRLIYSLSLDTDRIQLLDPSEETDLKCVTIHLTKGERVYGIFGILYSTTSPRSALIEQGMEIFHQVCQIISLVVVNRRMEHRSRFIFETFFRVNEKKGKKNIFQYIIDQLCSDESKFNAGIIHLYDEVEKKLYGYVSSGIEKKFQGSARIDIGTHVIGNVFKTGAECIMECASLESPFKEWAIENEFQTLICYQLRGIHEGEIGTISFFTKYPFVVDNSEKEFMDTLSREISSVVDEVVKEKRVEKLSSSDDIISQIISLERSTENILEILLREILEDLHGEVGYISIFSKTSDTIKAFSLVDISGKFADLKLPETLQVSSNDSISSYVIQKKQGYLYPSDPAVDQLYVSYVGIPTGEIKNELLVPMLYEDHVIGILVLSSSKEHTFDYQDLEFLMKTANKAAQVIQSRIFYEASKTLIEHPVENLEERDICKSSAEITCKVLSTSATVVWIIRKKDEEEYLKPEGWDSLEADKPYLTDVQSNSGSIEWDIISQARAGLFEHSALGIHFPKIEEVNISNANRLKQLGLRSMICMPIANGRDVIGLIATFTNRTYDFFGTEQVLLKNIASRCASAIANARLNEKNKILLDKWTSTNVLANPGIVALTFVHDITHIVHYIAEDLNLLDSLIPNNAKNYSSINDTLESLTEHTTSLQKSFTSLVRIGKQTKTKKEKKFIKELIDDVAHLFSKRYNDMNIDFTMNLENNDLKLLCSPNEIEQVLVNLILNSLFALRSVTHRKKQITITVESAEYKGEKGMKIEVFDNGVGIREEDLSKVFNPDYTTKGKQGSGFGLSICRRIIENNHGGSIFLASREGEWTRFYMYLPNPK